MSLWYNPTPWEGTASRLPERPPGGAAVAPYVELIMTRRAGRPLSSPDVTTVSCSHEQMVELTAVLL